MGEVAVNGEELVLSWLPLGGVEWISQTGEGIKRNRVDGQLNTTKWQQQFVHSVFQTGRVSSPFIF